MDDAVAMERAAVITDVMGTLQPLLPRILSEVVAPQLAAAGYPGTAAHLCSAVERRDDAAIATAWNESVGPLLVDAEAGWGDSGLLLAAFVAQTMRLMAALTE